MYSGRLVFCLATLVVVIITKAINKICISNFNAVIQHICSLIINVSDNNYLCCDYCNLPIFF